MINYTRTKLTDSDRQVLWSDDSKFEPFGLKSLSKYVEEVKREVQK